LWIAINQSGLNNVCKVRSKFPEDYCAKEEEECRDAPKVKGELVMAFPKPGFVDEALTVSFDDVINGI